MNKEEVNIIKKILGAEISSIILEDAQVSFFSNPKIVTYGSVAMRFLDLDNRRNSHYLIISAQPFLFKKTLEKFHVELKYFYKSHIPLSMAKYYPSQNLDSKYKCYFNFDELSKVKRINFFQVNHSNDGMILSQEEVGFTDIVELEFESMRSLYLIARNSGFEIEVRNSGRIYNVAKEFFS